MFKQEQEGLEGNLKLSRQRENLDTSVQIISASSFQADKREQSWTVYHINSDRVNTRHKNMK